MLRYLGWSYLAVLHVMVILLAVYPSGMQRLHRYLVNDPSVTEGYQGMVSAQEVVCAGLPDHAVVFLGDSRMCDLPVRVAVDDPAINLSIAGDTVKGLLGRIGRYRRLEAARQIVLGVGVNDLSHFSDDTLLANYRTLLQEISERGPKIIVVAIFPVNENKYEQANATYLSGQKVTNARIAGVNGAIRELCLQFSNVQFVDVNAALTSSDGNLRDEYSADGLHLTNEGSTAWAAALRLPLTRHSE
jgi:lysophospholipase L1-like esterase